MLLYHDSLISFLFISWILLYANASVILVRVIFCIIDKMFLIANVFVDVDEGVDVVDHRMRMRLSEITTKVKFWTRNFYRKFLKMLVPYHRSFRNQLMLS